MTDHFKDKQDQASQGLKSFKDQILADLAEGNRLRRQREEAFKADQEAYLTEELAEKQVIEEIESLDSPALEETSIVSMGDFSARPVDQEEQPQVAVLEDVDLTALGEVSAKKSAPVYPHFEEHDQLVQEAQPEVDVTAPKTDLGVTKVLSGFDKLFAGPDALAATEEVEIEEPVVAGLDLTETRDLSRDMAELSTEEPDLAPKAAPLSRGIMEELDEEEQVASRQRNHRVARKISLGLLGFLTILLLATGFFAYRYVDSAIKPLDASDNTYIQVEIPSGSGNKLIGQILEESGVIKSGRIFNFYTKFKNYTNFQSGYYNFQKSMSLDDISKKLQEGGSAEPERPVAGKILIPEGYTLEQIAKAVELNANTADKTDKTPYSADKFMALVQDQAFIAKMVDKYPSLLGSLPDANSVRYQLEGYLFPATYNYYEETSLEDLVDKMLETMDLTLAPYYTQMAASGLDVNQVLTLASLVEKEGATDDDRKLIAGVFYNRWNQGMPLQSNISILYAMGKLGEATTLREDAGIDTAIDSPFNIYVNPGLMPGPVDSPSLSAIKATVDPTDSDYLYFVADVTTGAVYYAEDFDTHNANVEKYINSHL